MPHSREADDLIARGDLAEARGSLEEACNYYRKAVTAAPQYSKAWLNLGVALESLGDADAACESYEAALRLEAANAYASYNLGKLLYSRGDLIRAQELLEAALAHKPVFPEAEIVLAAVYEAARNLEAAATALSRALKHRPDWVGALLNYGVILKQMGRSHEAEVILARALTLDPANADVANELAKILYARGAYEDAAQRLRRLIERVPEFQEAYRSLFYVCEAQQDLTAAADILEQALARWPDWDDALRHLGATLKKMQRLGEAEAVLRRAIVVAPNNPAGYQALGTIVLAQSRVAEALECFGNARRLDPESFELESAELFTLNLYDGISSEALLERHKTFGSRIEATHPARFKPFRNAKDPERPLRVGYVSGDFNSNPVSLFMIPLLEQHDRRAYEIYCYSTGTIVDDFTLTVQSLATWRDVSSKTHTELADEINHDRIDILVDLSGHSRETRLAAFAQQPAPVQVSWLGYLNTTGMKRIQYRLSDPHSDPPGIAECYHTESLWRLPRSQWCYRPRPALDYSSRAVPPCADNGYTTFGSFNDAPKISLSARKLWADILLASPKARMVLVGIPEGRAQDDLMRYFEDAGVHRSRITIAERASLQEYFGRFNEVDIALDTTPYSGGTTTCDAVWMGVPVVTVPGSRSVSRSTSSILTNLGLSEWIASSNEDYIRKALKFSVDHHGLRQLRQTLRQRMQRSSLMDEGGFARDVETAYRAMWRAWCSGARL
jgi:predicted O-linked N-acetylglucosamine transferase (SPINDLY family)